MKLYLRSDGQAGWETGHLWPLCPRWCSRPWKQPTGGESDFDFKTIHCLAMTKLSCSLRFYPQFDLNLRSRDPSWGIRDITELKEVGAAQGLNLDQVLKHNFPLKKLTQYKSQKSSGNWDACQQQNSCVRQKSTREALIKTAPITSVPFRAFVIQDLLRSDLQPTL